MEEKKIIPKGKQKLTDDELIRVSGGTSEDEYEMSCKICGKVFVRDIDLWQHEQTHHPKIAPYNPEQPDIAPVK